MPAYAYHDQNVSVRRYTVNVITKVFSHMVGLTTAQITNDAESSGPPADIGEPLSEICDSPRHIAFFC